MLAIEISIPARAQLTGIERAVETTCDHAGLSLVLKGTLKTYPGSIHWHFKRGAERGTLEITFWKTQRRLWFKVAAGRKAEWIDEVIPKLKMDLGKKLVPK